MSATPILTGNFPDRGPAVFAVTTATLILASVFVAARIVCRVGIVRHVSWDDYIIVLAWVFAFFLSFTIDLGTRKGLGRHDVNLNPADADSLRRCEYTFSVLYNPALMAAKTSILIFYLRLSRNTQKILRLASWAVLVIVNLAGTILTIMNIVQCRPVDASFDTYDGNPQCIPLLTEFICSAPVNIVTDLAILALPIPVLTGMRLPQRQKTILVITFALGVFVTIVDVIRIYYLQQAITYVPTGVSGDPQAIFGDNPEFAWNASLSLMWSAVEVNVGITCACIPTLKPLIIRILPSMLVDPDGTKTNDSQTQNSKLREAGHPTHDSSDDAAASLGPRLGGTLDQPSTAHPLDPLESGEMTAMEFLTTPNTGEFGAQRTATAATTASHARERQTSSALRTTNTRRSSIYFGFVNMDRPKSMLTVSIPESFRYCTIVTILFLLWGFSYGLLNTLNNVVAAVANMTVAQTLGLTSAYFGGGYFFGPLLVGEWLLRHDEHRRTKSMNHVAHGESVGGFKVTFIVGLLIYGTGTIMFWPSAVLTAFGGFMVSNFVVGFGLGVLETAANPFIALCGPADYAEMRLLLAQGVQAVGSVVSGLLAQKVFFTGITTGEGTNSLTLLDVQWTYLAVTMFCVLLALFFYYMPLPEVTDTELAKAASRLPVDPKKRSLGGLSLRTVAIIFAVAAQWTYVAAQESMSIFFHNLMTVLLPAQPGAINSEDQPPGLALSVTNYLLVAHTAFAISRFAAGYLSYVAVKYAHNRFVPTPRTLLAVSAALTILFGILVVALKPTANPNLLAIPIILFFFAEGPLWPLIFALGLRGQGRRTKRAAAWLTMGASGPAFWPFVIYGVINAGGSVQTAFVVVVVLVVVTLMYPLFLTFVRDARTLVDPRTTTAEAPGSSDGQTGGGMGRRESATTSELNIDEIIARRQRTASGAAAKEEDIGVLGRLSRAVTTRGRGRRTTMSSTSPVAEHREETD